MKDSEQEDSKIKSLILEDHVLMSMADMFAAGSETDINSTLGTAPLQQLSWNPWLAEGASRARRGDLSQACTEPSRQDATAILGSNDRWGPTFEAAGSSGSPP